MSVIPRLCGAAAVVVLAASAEAKNLPSAGTPRRIVSMNLCADELVLRLAERDRIAAVTWLARDPRGSTVSAEAAGLPAIHGLAEQIAGLKPDLVVAGVFTTRVAVGLLKRLHFPLVELGSPGDFEALRAQIRELAARLGVIDKGEALVAELDDRLAAAIPARPTGLRVLVMRPNALTVSPGSFGDAIIRAAGLVNVAAELGRGGAGQIPIEIAVSANADLIVIDADDGLPSLATVLLRHPVFRRLAEEGRVVSIPNRLWTCPGPQAAEVVSRLAQAAAKRIARQAGVNVRPQRLAHSHITTQNEARCETRASPPPCGYRLHGSESANVERWWVARPDGRTPPSPRTRGEDRDDLVVVAVSPKGEGEGAWTDETLPETPPHLRLPPRYLPLNGTGSPLPACGERGCVPSP